MSTPFPPLPPAPYKRIKQRENNRLDLCDPAWSLGSLPPFPPNDESGPTQRSLSSGRLVSMHSINPVAQAATTGLDRVTAAASSAQALGAPHKNNSGLFSPLRGASGGAGAEMGTGGEGGGKSAPKNQPNKGKKAKKVPKVKKKSETSGSGGGGGGGGGAADGKRRRAGGADVKQRPAVSSSLPVSSSMPLPLPSSTSSFSPASSQSFGPPTPASAAARAAFPAATVVDSRMPSHSSETTRASDATAVAAAAAAVAAGVAAAVAEATSAPATPKHARFAVARGGSATRPTGKVRTDDGGDGGGLSPATRVVRRVARYGSGWERAASSGPADGAGRNKDGTAVSLIAEGWGAAAVTSATAPTAGLAVASTAMAPSAVGVVAAPGVSCHGDSRSVVGAVVAATPTPTGSKKRKPSSQPSLSSSPSLRPDEGCPPTFTPAPSTTAAVAAAGGTAAVTTVPSVVRHNPRPMRASHRKGDEDFEYDYDYDCDFDLVDDLRGAAPAPAKTAAATGGGGFGDFGAGAGSTGSDARTGQGGGGRRPRPAGKALTGEMLGSPPESRGRGGSIGVVGDMGGSSDGSAGKGGEGGAGGDGGGGRGIGGGERWVGGSADVFFALAMMCGSCFG